MRIPVLHCDKGFTLIEFMISVFLLSVALFGLLSSLTISMNSNMENKMRNDASSLAEEYISKARSTEFSQLSTLGGAPNSPVVRKVLVGGVNVDYTVTTTVTTITTNTTSVSVNVTWPVKGIIKNFNITTSVSGS